MNLESPLTFNVRKTSVFPRPQQLKSLTGWMLGLLTLLQAPGLCIAAEYNLPARNRIDWTQTGVRGGVQQYVDSRPSAGPKTIDVTKAPYFVNPLSPASTGTIAAGSSSLTVANPANFAVNNTVNILSGWPETYTMTVSSGPSVSGNVTISLGGSPYTIAVTAGDSAATVAAKVRAAAYGPWKVNGSGTQAVFAFNQNTNIYQDLEATGPAGFAFTHVKVDGGASSAHTITAIAGSVFTVTPARTTAAPATGADVIVDASLAVQAALSATVSGGVVYLPEGTYRFPSPVYFGDSKDKTVRGAGAGKTLIITSGSGGAFQMGSGWDYLWNSSELVLTGSYARGATVLNMATTAGVTVGQMCHLAIDNSMDHALDTDLPVVIQMAGYPRSRNVLHRITAKTSGTVTISPPLAFPLPASLNPRLNLASRQVERCGIEDLKIESAASGAPFEIKLEQAVDCWVRNVEMRHSHNYALYLTRSLNCAVEKCYISDSQGGGSNHSGFLMDFISFCRIEDNNIVNFELCVQMNGSTGNVFGYNFFGQAVYNGFNINHGAHCSFNLYEGNILQSIQSDGYHGSGSQDVGFRNWVTCDKDIGNTTPLFQGYGIVLNRFARQYCFIGNLLGQPGDGMSYNYSFGNPNMGNGDSIGTASPSTGDLWATLSSGVYPWPAGTLRPDNAFQELDLDVEASTFLKHNWSSFAKGIIPGQALPAGDTLPKSLYLGARPAWFGELAWPPFDSSAPKFDPKSIPAGFRFLNGSNPPVVVNPPTIRPAPVTGLKKAS
ncbi:MAG: glycosyl hydrolase family 28-related protein [Verrucomicrobiota bacterium]